MEAARREYLVRLGVASDRVQRVGVAQDARIVLVNRRAVLLHERQPLRRRKLQLLRELARLVERTEVAGIGFERLQVVSVRLLACDA